MLFNKDERIKDKKAMIQFWQTLRRGLYHNAIFWWIVAYFNAALPLMPMVERVSPYSVNAGLAVIFAYIAMRNSNCAREVGVLIQNCDKEIEALEQDNG